MSQQVNIHEAKSRLSQLIEAATHGDSVVIAKAGKPVARLVAYETPVTNRTLGVWRGQVWIADDFDTLPPELLAVFQGENE